MAAPDPLVFARNLLLTLRAGTAIADWPIDGASLEEGREPPVILLNDGGGLRDPDLPAFNPYRLAVRSYGTSEEQARSGLRTVSDLLHRRSRTATADGTLLEAFDELGLQPPGRDPDTGWPTADGVIDLYFVDQ